MAEISQKISKREIKKKKRNKTLKGRIVHTRDKAWELKNPQAIRKKL